MFVKEHGSSEFTRTKSYFTRWVSPCDLKALDKRSAHTKYK